MGKDSAGLDAILSFGGKGPAITGRASVTRLSLTRWLGFGRWITPGLQVALDQVSEGIIDFTSLMMLGGLIAATMRLRKSEPESKE